MTYPTGGFDQPYQQPYQQPQYQQPQQPYPYPYTAPPPPGYGPPANVAGMGQRLLARLIDGLLLGLAWAVVYGIFLGVMFLLGAFDRSNQDTGAIIAFGVLLFVLSYILLPLSVAAYEVVLIGQTGATVGKRVMGIKVVNEHTHQPIGIGQSLLRWVIPVALSFVCVGWLVYLSPLFDNSGRNQGWHDRAANDLVIATG